MRNLLTAIVLLFTFSSFTGDHTIQTATQQQLIIYDGCFEDGGITVIISYNPGLGQIVDVTVSGPSGSYAVISHSGNSSIYNVGSTLYTNGFIVYFDVPGSGTHTASTGSGELSSDCY